MHQTVFAATGSVTSAVVRTVVTCQPCYERSFEEQVASLGLHGLVSPPGSHGFPGTTGSDR
eukprot:252663-Amphidinium_carterae.3